MALFNKLLPCRCLVVLEKHTTRGHLQSFGFGAAANAIVNTASGIPDEATRIFLRWLMHGLPSLQYFYGGD